MSRVANVAILIVCFLIPGVALADVKSEIESRGKQWQAKFSAGDAVGLASVYAEDAQLLPPEADAVVGRAAIQEFWHGLMKAGPVSITLETLEVYGHGKFATEIGRYSVKSAEGQEVDHGKFIVLWKKSKSSWELFRDIWNSSVAPAPK